MNPRTVMTWLLRQATPYRMPWRKIGQMFGVHGETARGAASRVDRAIEREMVKLTVERDTDPPWLQRLRQAGAVGCSEPSPRPFESSRQLVREWRDDIDHLDSRCRGRLSERR